MILLNLSRSPSNTKFLRANFYNLVPGQLGLGNSQKEISGKSADLVTNVLKELQVKKEPAMLYVADPDVPKSVTHLLRRAIINYNETLPQADTMVVKVWKDLQANKKHVCAMWYPQEQFMGINPIDGAIGGQGGPPTLAAVKTLKFLNDGPRFPVKLEFEDGIPQSVKDLFTEVINVYNKSLEPKIKS